MAEIEVRGLTKNFGRVTAVRDVSFTAPAGMITGLLGPNGSGKTTTLRIALGLIRASAGEALIGGSAYRRLDRPRRVVGAMLESTGFHPGRRARDHLRVLAAADDIPARRVDEVLDLAGADRLRDDRRRRRARLLRRRPGHHRRMVGRTRRAPAALSGRHVADPARRCRGQLRGGLRHGRRLQYTQARCHLGEPASSAAGTRRTCAGT